MDAFGLTIHASEDIMEMEIFLKLDRHLDRSNNISKRNLERIQSRHYVEN